MLPHWGGRLLQSGCGTSNVGVRRLAVAGHSHSGLGLPSGCESIGNQSFEIFWSPLCTMLIQESIGTMSSWRLRKPANRSGLP